MDVSLTVSPLLGDVKTRILLYLSDGEKSMGGLSSFLQINKTAVKEHMETLERMGYVRSFFRKEKTGRPSKYYEITKMGMELFPKKYAQLMEAFIAEVKDEMGEMKLNLILGRVADRIISRNDFNSTGNMTEREAKIEKLKSFVDTLNNLGYYARMEIDGEIVRIIRHNCIFYEMAKTNGKVICDVLGKDLIEKSGEKNFTIVEKFSDGGNKCVVEVDLDNK
ncbi:MAG: ArsR family transcriptional regulator [Candidatus Thermoplasmatota archaeon]|jgi:predicted ArsR family transcriptional regulator|nr:ArsR family transcriptional regulator [Candidatus Thermoplasmatota archaeon]